VQAEAASALVSRFHRRPPGPTSGAAPRTRATSIAVGRPRNAVRLLREVRASGGTLVAVSDEAIGRAQRCLAREAGVAVEFSSAATWAGLEALAASLPLAGLEAVLVLTGGRLDEGD